MTLVIKSHSVPEISKSVMFIVEKQPEDDSSQAFVPTQNGSPRLSRAEAAARPAPQEAYDVVLQRKEKEGFGFVILTSKNKPPPGGKGGWVLPSQPNRGIRSPESPTGVCETEQELWMSGLRDFTF